MINIRPKYTSKIKNWLKEEAFKRLLKNASTLLIGDTGATIVNMIAIIVILKAIGVKDYGLIVLIQAFVLTIDQIFNFQSWQAFIKYGSDALESRDSKRLKKLIKQGTILDISTAILGTVIGITSIGFIGHLLHWGNNVIHLGSIYCLSILFHFSGIPTGILRIYDKFFVFSIQKVLGAALKLIGTTIAFFLNSNVEVILYILFATDIIGSILLVVIAHYIIYKNKLIDWWKEKKYNSKEFLSFAIWTNLSSTLTIPVKQLDVFIVSSTISVEMVGVYKLFKQLAGILSRLVDPIYQSIYPQFASIIARNNKKEVFITAIKVSIIISIFIVPILFLTIATSQWWLKVFFGNIFAENWIYLAIFITYMALDTITAPVHPLFDALGYAKQKFFIMGIGNIVYLVFAWYMSSAFGIVGIIHAWGIQFFIITTMKCMYIYRKNIKLNTAIGG